jgi:hypothetical protein
MGNLSNREMKGLYKEVLPKPSETGENGQIRWGLGLRVVVETCAAMVAEGIKTRIVKIAQNRVDRDGRV